MFFFDAKLNLYINDSPMLISTKALAAAQRLGLDLKWNADGQICGVSHEAAQLLSRELGIVQLSIKDFMSLAKREPRVASSQFAEWLTDLFTLNKDGIPVDGNGHPVDMPTGRPGWFKLEDTDVQGFPTQLVSKNALHKWKFWSPGEIGLLCGAVRSFVTSSGTCSLDLGIPTFATHRNLMIRECYSAERAPIDSPIEAIWNIYEDLTLNRRDPALRDFFQTLDLDNLVYGQTPDKFRNDKEREMFLDLKGKKVLLGGSFATLKAIGVGEISDALEHKSEDASTFVIGHPRPDADSLVGAIFEAARRTLLDPQKITLPWAEVMPSEVAYILGPHLARKVAGVHFSESDNHRELVLVDCHNSLPSDQAHLVRSVIDHHIVRKRFPWYVAVSQEVSWSSTIQVYIKLLGSGLDLEPSAARILAEATALEAEPGLIRFMSDIDRLAVQRLQDLALQTTSYQDLMDAMTRFSNIEELFYKDYRQTSYGFAVIKCTQPLCFDAIADRNNYRYHLPLTIAKVVLYNDSYTSVLSEVLSLSFHPLFYDKGFRSAVTSVIARACQAFHGIESVEVQPGRLIIRKTAFQTPRLLLSPLVEELVAEQLRFLYSRSLNRFISCGFYSGPSEVYGTPGAGKVQSRLSYRNVKDLLQASKNTSLLSLADFWKLHSELVSLGDSASLQSLTDKHFVEILDTLIYNKRMVKNGDSKIVSAVLCDAKPALICPNDPVEEATGIPVYLRSPNTNNDKSLWRYWSPDDEINVATRGHIFVMDQTCIDLKISPDESTEMLTFRPTYMDIPDLRFEVEPDGDNWVKLTVHPRMFTAFDL